MKTIHQSRTRAPAQLRQYLLNSGLVKTVMPMHEVQGNEVEELRHKGRLACSHIDAVLSRRHELGRA